MAEFLGDIAFVFELAIMAGGLVLLHQAKKESAALLRWAGLVLLMGGIGTAACTGYFWIRYHLQGDFGAAYPSMPHQMMMHGDMGAGGMPMHPPGMMQGMPMGAPMKREPQAAPSAGEPQGAAAEGNDAHSH